MIYRCVMPEPSRARQLRSLLAGSGSIFWKASGQALPDLKGKSPVTNYVRLTSPVLLPSLKSEAPLSPCLI